MQVCKVVRLSLSPILATHVSTSFSPLHSLRLPAGASLSIYIDIHIYIYIYRSFCVSLARIPRERT